MRNKKNTLKTRVLSQISQRLFFLTLFSALTLLAAAQNKSISGTVVDTGGEPIIGASVLVKGTTNGVITDLDGHFTLTQVPVTATIQVSYIGYKSQEIAVRDKSSIKVILVEDTEVLDEVVVVGYGVQKKSDITGAMKRF